MKSRHHDFCCESPCNEDEDHRPCIEDSSSAIQILCVAAQYGYTDILEKYIDCGFKDEPTVQYCAARGGQTECLRLLYAAGYIHDDTLISHEALMSRNVECIEYVMETGCSFVDDESVPVAARHCPVYILKRVVELGAPLTDDAIWEAGMDGRVDSIEYLRSIGCPWDTLSPLGAAMTGEKECIDYLLDNGCPFDESLTEVTASRGHWDLLRHLISRGCPIGPRVPEAIAETGDIKFLKEIEAEKYWTKTATFAAASAGELKCLKYLIDNGCPYDSETFAASTSSSDLACFEYLKSIGCPMGPEAVRIAARDGDIDMLRYLVSLGFPIEEDALTSIVSNVDAEFFTDTLMECFEFLVEKKCPISTSTLSFAAQDNNMRVLEYAFSQKDCPKNDPHIAAMASLGGHLECLRYLYENGCPVTEEAIEEAIWNDHVDCFKFAMTIAGDYKNTEKYLKRTRKRSRIRDFLEPLRGSAITIA